MGSVCIQSSSDFLKATWGKMRKQARVITCVHRSPHPEERSEGRERSSREVWPQQRGRGGGGKGEMDTRCTPVPAPRMSQCSLTAQGTCPSPCRRPFLSCQCSQTFPESKDGWEREQRCPRVRAGSVPEARSPRLQVQRRQPHVGSGSHVTSPSSLPCLPAVTLPHTCVSQDFSSLERRRAALSQA